MTTSLLDQAANDARKKPGHEETKDEHRHEPSPTIRPHKKADKQLFRCPSCQTEFEMRPLIKKNSTSVGQERKNSNNSKKHDRTSPSKDKFETTTPSTNDIKSTTVTKNTGDKVRKNLDAEDLSQCENSKKKRKHGDK